MDIKERIKALKSLDLFATFTTDELFQVADKTEEVFCHPEEILLEEGTVSDEFFVLLEGRLSVHKGKRILSELVAVDYVGEMAIIDAKPRSATVRVQEESVLLRVPAVLFQEYFVKKPSSLLEIMKILSKRIRLDNEVIVREFEQTNILVHDMRNLLSLFLFLDNFKTEKGSVQEKHISFMKTARKHLSSLVEQALANVKHLVIPESRTRNLLQDLLHEMAESDFVIHPDLTGFEFSIREEDELPEFNFSRPQIRRVLLNLVVNAAQASEPGDEITLSLAQLGDKAVIEVKDHGSGIKDDVAEKVFDLHFTTKRQGNGLGLASCRQIVEENHGGSLSFAANADGGTTFRISLPMGSAGPTPS